MLIAFAGKGGTGKSTLTALTLSHLLKNEFTPVLVIDADHNSTMPDLLGVAIPIALCDIKQEVRENRTASGMTRPDYLELAVQQAIVEERGYDLLVMGNPDGPGCYCSVNNLLKTTLARLQKNYPYILVDCAAGLEHFSRQILPAIDILAVVAGPGRKGIRTAKTIIDKTAELSIPVEKQLLLINRAPHGYHIPAHLAGELEALQLRPQFIPEDPELAKADEAGQSYLTLTPAAAAAMAVRQVFSSLPGSAQTHGSA